MSKYINEDASYFENFDFDNAKAIKHPIIVRLQKRAKLQNEIVQFFDRDVLEKIRCAYEQNDEQNRQKANNILRAFFN